MNDLSRALLGDDERNVLRRHFAGESSRVIRTPEHVSDRKTIDHPEVGRVTVDCDELTVAGSDLRIIVYSAPPGSDDARALALLSITRSARDTAGV